MANTVKIKRSAVSGKVPLTTDLELGELALNTFDGKLYTKKDNGTVSIIEVGGGAGDFVGPASSTDNAIVRFDGTTGKLVQNSGVIIDDSGNLLVGNNVSPTSTTTPGSIVTNGLGIYPYIASATNTANAAEYSGITYFNSTPFSFGNGAAQQVASAIVSTPQISNSGAGGSNLTAVYGVFSVPVIESSGATARISATGVLGDATRASPTDTSTNASNALIGGLFRARHLNTIPDTAKSANVVGVQGISQNLSGTIAGAIGFNCQMQIGNATTSLATTTTMMAGFRVTAFGIGSTTGGAATVTDAYGLRLAGPVVGASGTVTNYYGVFIHSATVTGTLTNRYGVYQEDAAATNYFAGQVRAPIFYDSNNTAYYFDGSSTGTSINVAGNIIAAGDITANGGQVYTGISEARVKLAVWDSSLYGIGMQAGHGHGGLDGYAMTFQMNNTTGRGFWWGNDAHTNLQGAMSLTTNGKLAVAHSVRVGFGESDLVTPGAAYVLEVNGSFAATTKSFVIDHPTKPGMKLRYGSLEGPENGVYVRGRLRAGNIIELPDYWTGLVDEDSITVSLTAIGKSQDFWVEDIIDNTVVIGGENINCFYVVFAERKDVDKLEVEF